MFTGDISLSKLSKAVPWCVEDPQGYGSAQLEGRKSGCKLPSGGFQVSELFIIAETTVEEPASTEFMCARRSRLKSFGSVNRIGFVCTHFMPSFRQRSHSGVNPSPNQHG